MNTTYTRAKARKTSLAKKVGQLTQAGAFAWALGAASPALAQDDPSGLLSQTPVSSGTTDVANTGFKQAEKPPAESKDATELSVAAGSLLTTGNAKAVSATAVSKFRMRRTVHQFSVDATANVGRASTERRMPMKSTVENYQGRVRYDYFVSDNLALFYATSGRYDPFQGLSLRLNIDPGVAYYFIDLEKHRFWGELGYDLQHDIRQEAFLKEAALEGPRPDKTQTRHNGRLFVGYDNEINDKVSFSTAAEYLQAFSPFRDVRSDHINWRLNWDAAVTSSLTKSFSIATTVTVKYDNNPLPGVINTDAITAFNLVYKML